jgi:hypothetical protein
MNVVMVVCTICFSKDSVRSFAIANKVIKNMSGERGDEWPVQNNSKPTQ